MNNGRQTTRALPVEVKVGTDGDSIWAKPLPWRKRNDLGNKITQAYVDAINKSLRSITENDNIVFSGGYREAEFDWDTCLAAAFPDLDKDRFEPLDIWDIRAILCAACDVNGLELQYMIDPNVRDLLLSQVKEAEQTDGQKTTSSDDSGDTVIQLPTSSN